MRGGIASCQNLIGQRAPFLTCYRAFNEHEASRVLSDDFVFCGLQAQATKDDARDICDGVDSNRVNWISKNEEDGLSLDFYSKAAWSQDWTGFRLSEVPNGPRVLLPKKAIDNFLDELWSYRNRHLVYVLPLIFTMFVFIALATITLVMNPIRGLEKSLNRMSADNLGTADTVNSKYKEFDGITNIYKDLRLRLDESFRKARNFTSYASHELKTPLTILRGTAEQLIAQLPVGSSAQVQAGQMGEEVERLIEITDKLLLLSRADAKALVAQRKDLDFSGFLDVLVEDAALFQEGIQIESDIAPGLVWHCDRVLIKQLVHNLYTNAVKYNVPGGYIRFVLQRLGDTLTLTVSNSCANVSSDVVDHAFDRFFRGDPSRSRSVDGLGLGLSICQEIAKVHQGSLRFVLQDKSTVALTLTAPLHF
jgi:signal transduction histidine kinase